MMNSSIKRQTLAYRAIAEQCRLIGIAMLRRELTIPQTIAALRSRLTPDMSDEPAAMTLLKMLSEIEREYDAMKPDIEMLFHQALRDWARGAEVCAKKLERLGGVQ